MVLSIPSAVYNVLGTIIVLCTVTNADGKCLQLQSDNGTLCVDKCDSGYYEDDGWCTPCPLGYFCLGGKAKACPKGLFQDQVGRNSCQTCSPGFHQSEDGSADCVPCPIGLYCNETTHATKCPPGTFQFLMGQQSCIPCPPGQFQPDEASAQCNSCPAGHMCPIGSIQPIPCPAGTFQDRIEQDECVRCTDGFYQTENASITACIPCPGGYRCNDVSQEPEICPVNTYSDKGMCQPCPAGYFQDKAGQKQCEICLPGNYCPQGYPHMLPCKLGQHQPSPGQSSCIGCPYAGTFGNTTGLKECYRCPPGYRCVEGWRNPDPCLPGWLWNGVGDCWQCPVGTYQSNYAGLNCTICPRGHYCENSNLVAPTPCPAGYYQDLLRQSQCKLCPKGHWCMEKAIFPTPCRPGYFQNEVGQSSCKLCAQYSYQVRVGGHNCHTCPRGYICNHPARVPIVIDNAHLAALQHYQQCNPGTRLIIQANQVTCEACPKGTYQSRINGTECTACPENFYCPDTLVEPRKCRTGTRSAASSTVCEICPDGTYNDGSTKGCVNCPLGFICTKGRQTKCPAGHFTSYGTCVPCPDGHFQRFSGSIECFSCPTGHKCPAGGIEPQPCEPGTFMNDIRRNLCANCPSGHMCPLSAMVYPIKCQAGEYQQFEGQTACQACPRGYYNIEVAQTSCTPCPPGHRCKSSNQSPVPCAIDTYQNEAQQVDCKKCPENRYQPLIGQTNCIECPAGYYCPFLTHDGVAGNSFFPEDETALENRRKRQTHSARQPRKCPAGTYSPSGGVSCTPCPAGHYSPTPGSGGCQACPGGTACPAPGNKKPYQCPNGQAVNCHAERGCNKCPPGRASGRGKVNCLSAEEADKNKGTPCAGDPGWGCAKKQAKCVFDAAMNTASGGLYTAVDMGIDAMEWGGDTAFGPEVKEMMGNLAVAAPVTGFVSSRIGPAQEPPKWASKYEDKLSSIKGKYGIIKRGVENTAVTAKCYMEKGCQEANKLADPLEQTYQAVKTLDDLADASKGADPNSKKMLDWIGKKWDKIKEGREEALANFVKKHAGKAGTLGRKVAEKIGKKIPFVCNVIEGLSEDCRNLGSYAVERFGNNAKDCKRRRRSVDSQSALVEFTVLASPLLYYFDNHQDVYYFLLSADDKCHTSFRNSWSRTEGDRSEFISQSELENVLDACVNVTVPGFFDPLSIVTQFNDSFTWASKGFVDHTILEDVLHGFAVASESIPEDFWDRTDNETAENIGELIFQESKAMLQNMSTISSIVQHVPNPRLPTSQAMYLVGANPPAAAATDKVLVEVHLPVISGKLCDLRAITEAPINGTVPISVKIFYQNGIEDRIYVPDIVDGNVLWYTMLCDF